jgi:hypothetical protein
MPMQKKIMNRSLGLEKIYDLAKQIIKRAAYDRRTFRYRRIQQRKSLHSRNGEGSRFMPFRG